MLICDMCKSTSKDNKTLNAIFKPKKDESIAFDICYDCQLTIIQFIKAGGKCQA